MTRYRAPERKVPPETKGSDVKISDSKRDEVLVIGFEGSLTTWDLLEVGPQLRSLIASAASVVVFDLSGVDDVGAGGISMLRAAHSQLGEGVTAVPPADLEGRGNQWTLIWL